MEISFKPLLESHFPLLLKWLEKPHVKTWWDPDILWTEEQIRNKYRSYVQGYKLENGVVKTIHAFIIEADDHPIGYIQVYNAYDFPRSSPLSDLPEYLAAFDILIGDQEYLSKGIGSLALTLFWGTFFKGNYQAVFADPDRRNIAAIRAYEKAGFKKMKENPATNETWMLKDLS